MTELPRLGLQTHMQTSTLQRPSSAPHPFREDVPVPLRNPVLGFYWMLHHLLYVMTGIFITNNFCFVTIVSPNFAFLKPIFPL
ncbi:hypothetical protein [Peribacillus glennii]|uniref:hypothetical protein n=1 Tax=Peribacillus glennii TaxID=2303991 RepID=UPI001F45B672|nr:hypothetical protein [Peribacillus glennii]